MDPGIITAIKLAGSAAQWLHGKANEAEERNTKPFVESATEQYLGEQLKALELRVAGLEPEAVAALAQRLDSELAYLLRLYTLEAALEAQKERRRMLAWASASMFDDQVSIEIASGTFRTLRLLDQNDVLLLADLSEVKGEMQRNDAAKQPQYGLLEALRAAGCVWEDQAGFGGVTQLRITTIGARVLRALSDYVAVRRAEAKNGS
jgi:hypothetical protein